MEVFFWLLLTAALAMLGSIVVNLLTSDMNVRSLFSAEKVWQWIVILMLIIAASAIQFFQTSHDTKAAHGKDNQLVSSSIDVLSEEHKQSFFHSQSTRSVPKSETASLSRLELYQFLLELPIAQFELILFDLSPPRGNIPPSSASQGQRVSALFNWLESPVGPGLKALLESIERSLD